MGTERQSENQMDIESCEWNNARSWLTMPRAEKVGKNVSFLRQGKENSKG